MSNGQQCCAAGICCPPGSEAQRSAWIEMIKHERPHFTDEQAAAAADRVLEAHGNFDDVVDLIDQPAAV